MDPNACLQRIADASDRAEERNAIDDLHTWLSGGGFAPHWAMHPDATRVYVRRYGWRPSMPEAFRPRPTRPGPASVKLHTLYRTRKHLHSIAVVEKHRSTRGGQFPIPKLYQLTEIHDGVADGVEWYDDEATALKAALELGYTTA